MKTIYFKKNPYLFIYRDRNLLTGLSSLGRTEKQTLTVLKTHWETLFAASPHLVEFLSYFDGRTAWQTIISDFSTIERLKLYYLEITANSDEYQATFVDLKIPGNISSETNAMEETLKILCKAGLLMIDNSTKNSKTSTISTRQDTSFPKSQAPLEPSFTNHLRTDVTSPVLLLGDTLGNASTGLLYLASYLRRNGIEAYCHWNNNYDTRESLKHHILALLEQIRPKIVGISLKWFTHIARCLYMAKIIKSFDASITVVLGGNTASYFAENLAMTDAIDYVIQGDGELPLLKICQQSADIPNIVYCAKGRLVSKPISYVQNEQNSSDIYLSHMEELFIPKHNIFLTSRFYVYTGKGCSMSCAYCAGCREVQEKSFKRSSHFFRGIPEVVNDLNLFKKYGSTFTFDFDPPGKKTVHYYQSLFSKINLSEFFCEFICWQLPSQEMIHLLAKTFKFSALVFDVCSFSEPHRKKLQDLGILKPQPTDDELHCFLNECEKHSNLEVVITYIAGLPFFDSKEISRSQNMIAMIRSEYPGLSALAGQWLHAQPGAPIVKKCLEYGLYSQAETYEDFLFYSHKYMKKGRYPHPTQPFVYPYIFPKDKELKAEIDRFLLWEKQTGCTETAN